MSLAGLAAAGPALCRRLCAGTSEPDRPFAALVSTSAAGAGLPGACRLGAAATHPAEPSRGLDRPAPHGRRLGIVECPRRLAAGAAAPGQPGPATGCGLALSPSRPALERRLLHSLRQPAGRGASPAARAPAL